ncbi:MAG: hypothetical protein EZS28_034753 [Streblomastix strix]|uniref:Uncharacterized protein n=1 Tax=Streblomastix strix TaxID=222440 RepID=A0A5J4UGL7_9EUKA|nr:MAG: hypothetical protein EZS28_034753 [Streblomastix strix]
MSCFCYYYLCGCCQWQLRDIFDKYLLQRRRARRRRGNIKSWKSTKKKSQTRKRINDSTRRQGRRKNAINDESESSSKGEEMMTIQQDSRLPPLLQNDRDEYESVLIDRITGKPTKIEIVLQGDSEEDSI